jgi:hypothetical protein
MVAIVRYRDLWGPAKRVELLDSLEEANTNSAYKTANPDESNRFSLRPGDAAIDYASWPSLPELSELMPFSGVVEKRRGALMSLDRAELADRMRRYFDPDVSFSELKAQGIGPVEDMARFNAAYARQRLLLAESYSDQALRRATLVPFESR